MRQAKRSRPDRDCDYLRTPECRAMISPRNTGNSYAVGHNLTTAHRAAISAAQKWRHARNRSTPPICIDQPANQT